ncbi:hypothetical protein [Streptomyces sp. NPDC089919]|uniref:hypothetical protein n=1 Tax=Streptomyces sp. NPDC089919 TaxID=3155188 RepID=UPI00341555BF
MEGEAASLLVTGLGLPVEASAAHPGGVCRATATRCLICHGPGRLQRLLGSTVVRCDRCRGGVGVRHDPVHCWQQLR